MSNNDRISSNKRGKMKTEWRRNIGIKIILMRRDELYKEVKLKRFNQSYELQFSGNNK